MKCNQCGQECSREEQTCQKCGTSLDMKYSFDEIDFVFDEIENSATENAAEGTGSLEEHTLEQTMKQQHKKAKWMIGGIAFLIGIFLVFFSVIKQSTKPVEYAYVPISSKGILPLSIMIDGINKIALLRLDGELTQTIESDQLVEQSFSLSYDVVALIVGSNHQLYVATDKEQISLDTFVETVLVSQDGTSVAYIKNVYNNLGDLYIYDLNTKTTSKIASQVSIHNYQLSPDGESIAFCRVQEDGVLQDLYVSIDKKEPKRIASGESPVGISNHGKYLYVMGEDEFYVINGEKHIRLGDEFSVEGTRIMFNLDYSQVLYYDDGRSYLSIDGNISKLDDSMIYGVQLPLDASMAWRTIGISNFTNHLVQKEGGIYYLNDQYELNFVCQNTGYIQVAKNMDSLLINEDNELYLYKDFQNKTVTKKRIGDISGNRRFIANSDLSIVYYVNDNNDLYSIKEDEKPIKIADNVAHEFYYYDGYCYYLTDMDEKFEGNIYYSVNQEPGKKVKNLERGFLGGMFGITITGRYSEGNIYTIRNGEAKPITSDINNHQ